MPFQVVQSMRPRGHGRDLCGAVRQSMVMMLVVVMALVGAGRLAPADAQTGPAATGEWTAAEWAKARRLSPLPPPPPDATNALADHERAAKLGHQLFFDPRLSPHGVSCATCHQPERRMTDGLPVGHTLAPVHRNTMTIVNAAYYRWLGWDGARDSLWHQAVGPIESPKEMGSSRLHVVRAVMQHYGEALQQIVELPAGWGAMWPQLPPAGQPGEAAFDHLPPDQQAAVNRVFTTILKCLAAYERRIVSADAPFDRYVAGDTTALSWASRRGFQHFLRLACDTCHNTPLFSDDEFHNLALPPVPEADPGRAAGLPQLQQSSFRGTGPYADGPPVVRAEDYRVGNALIGTFRTPSLREVAETGPYGHNGAVATLEDWLTHYVEVSTNPPTDMVGRLAPSLAPTRITAQERQELIAFLASLSSDYTSAWTQLPKALEPVLKEK
jgi:cytochrome c peroxidase